MTTPYLTNDQYAVLKGYDDFDAFHTVYPKPTAAKLTQYLTKATRILNNRQHLNCGTTNVSNTDYLDDVKDYCVSIAERMRDVEQNRGMKGGLFTFSPQDFLHSYERNDILLMSVELGFRKVGDVQ